MNILLVTWNFPPKLGGMENVTYELYKRLGRLHHLYTIAPYAKSNKEECPGNIVYRCPFRPLPLFFIYVLFKGAEIVKEKEIDIILAGSAFFSLPSSILGWIFRKKTISHVFGLDVTYRNRLYQYFVRSALKKSDAVISISNVTKAELVKRGIQNERIWVIHPGVETNLFGKDVCQEELKKKYGLENKKVLLSICRLAKRKGIIEFIRYCLPLIRKKIPDITYIIIGENPRDSMSHRDDVAGQIRRIIEGSSLEGHVRLLGNLGQETLIEYYYLCDLFILPVIPAGHDIEGFGLVFIEANAAGKAAVGSNIGGIPEAIEDKKSGILVEPSNYSALQEAITGLLGNPQKLLQMGAYARKRAREQFDWDKVIKDYLKVIDAVSFG